MEAIGVNGSDAVLAEAMPRGQQPMALRKIRRKNTRIMKEMSNIPTGGMMRRNGRTAQSVRSMSSRLTCATPPPDWTGNQESTARANSRTMKTVISAQRTPTGQRR